MHQGGRADDVWWARPLARRRVLAGGLGAAAAALLGDAVWARPAHADDAVPPPVADLPTGEPDRSLFAPTEQVLASYLLITAPMANDVVVEGDSLGFMSGGWWRNPAEPFNARVQEQVATLSWFHGNDRDWNPYFQDDTLLARLDEAIRHYLGLQNSNGAFPEYTSTESSRAATGFGLTALTETLENLRLTGSLPETQAALEGAIRAASTWVLDLDSGAWKTPLSAANQSVAGLVGAARAARALGDADLAASVDGRIDFVAANGQAPAGFFHEPLGFDFGYNFYVMLPDLADLYLLTGNPKLVEMAKRWTEFASFATTREPDGSGYVVYSAASSRGDATTMQLAADDDTDRGALSSVFLDQVPQLAAFRSTREERAMTRARWATPEPGSEGEELKPREKLDTSPRQWMYVLKAPDDAAAQQAAAAERSLPYLASERFTESRLGTLDQQYLFVRRPGYYLAGMYGTRSTAINRTGIGMLWNPGTGILGMALNLFNGPGWSIVDDAGVDSAVGDATVSYLEGELTKKGPTIEQSALARQLGTFTVHSVSASNGSVSDLVLWDDGFRLQATLEAGGNVAIPLVLKATDSLVFSNGTAGKFGGSTSASATGLTLMRDGVRTEFNWVEPVNVQLKARGMYLFPDQARRMHVLTVPFTGTRQIDVTIADQADLDAALIPMTASASGRVTNGRRWVVARATNLEKGPVNVTMKNGLGQRTFANVPAGQSVVGWLEGSATIDGASTLTVTGHRVANGKRYSLTMDLEVTGP